jgi:HSP20 family protein
MTKIVVGAAGLQRLEIQQLRERVGRLFEALQEAVEGDDPFASGTWAPPVDLCEAEDAIHVRVELPGVPADAIKIGLTSAQLRVYGEKPRRVARRRITSHHCSERRYGRFSRIVPLRWPISVRNATAELVNGLLIIRLPKLSDRRGGEFKIPVVDKNNL